MTTEDGIPYPATHTRPSSRGASCWTDTQLQSEIGSTPRLRRKAQTGQLSPPSKRDLAVDEIVNSRSPKGGGEKQASRNPKRCMPWSFFFFSHSFFFSSSEVSKDQGSLVLQKTNGIGIHDTLGVVYDRSSRMNTIRWQLRSASCCCCYCNPTTTAPHRSPSDT